MPPPVATQSCHFPHVARPFWVLVPLVKTTGLSGSKGGLGVRPTYQLGELWWASNLTSLHFYFITGEMGNVHTPWVWCQLATAVHTVWSSP